MKRSIQTTLLPLSATIVFAGLVLLIMLETKESIQFQEQIRNIRLITILVMAASLIAMVWLAILEISSSSIKSFNRHTTYFNYRRSPEEAANKQLDLFTNTQRHEQFFIATGSRPSEN